MKDARRPGGQLSKHDRGVNLVIKSKITPLFMSFATPVYKFISNHAIILLKEIKDENRFPPPPKKKKKKKKKKKMQKPMTLKKARLTTSDQSLLKLFNHHFQQI